MNVYKISTWSEGVIVFNGMKIVNQLNSFIESMICFLTANGNSHCLRNSVDSRSSVSIPCAWQEQQGCAPEETLEPVLLQGRCHVGQGLVPMHSFV